MRNAWDIAPASIAALILGGVKKFFILDHDSRAPAPDLKQLFKGEADFEIFRKETPPFYQGVALSWLSALARQEGFDFVVPFDADEFWISRDPMSTISSVLSERLSPENPVGSVRVRNFVQSLSVGTFSLTDLESCRFEAGPVPDRPDLRQKAEALQIPFVTLAFPKKAVYQLSVEHAISEGNHGTKRGGIGESIPISEIEVLHLPYRSRGHLVTKRLHGHARNQSGFDADVGWQNRYLAAKSDFELDAYWKLNSWNTSDISSAEATTRFFERSDDLVDLWRRIQFRWPSLLQYVDCSESFVTASDARLALALDCWGRDSATSERVRDQQVREVHELLESTRQSLSASEIERAQLSMAISELSQAEEQHRQALRAATLQADLQTATLQAVLSSRSWRWTHFLRRKR